MEQQLKDKPQQEEKGFIPPPKKKQKNSGIWGKIAVVLSAAALIISCLALLLVIKPELREWLSDKIGWRETVKTITYRDRELPVLKHVAANRYDKECFQVEENGWITYKEGRKSAKVGIDVSFYQGDVDWKQVADSGVSFAMIRVGYRGYSKGVIMPDSKFEENIQGALEAGLEVGVYFFSQAINAQEAQEEAEYVINAVKNYDITYPVAFDWEHIAGSSDARTNNLSPEQVTQCAKAFSERVAKAGYTPMIYFNQDQGYLEYQLDQLTDYPFWLAEYNAQPNFYYHFDLWQYTHTAQVPGIQGNVDMNLDFRSIPA